MYIERLGELVVYNYFNTSSDCFLLPSISIFTCHLTSCVPSPHTEPVGLLGSERANEFGGVGRDRIETGRMSS